MAVLTWMVLAAGTCLSQSAIRIEKVETGLDGYVRGERWIPVVIELQNYGAHFQGIIEIIRGQTSFRRHIDVSAGTARRAEVLVFMSTYLEPMLCRILDQNGRQVIQRKLEPRMLNYQDNLILVVSDTDFNHQFVNGVQNPWGGKTYVAYKKSADLFSDFISYSTADAIALGTFSVDQIPPAKWKALILSVAAGGVLICSATTDFSILTNPWLQKDLPDVTPEYTATSKGEFLSHRYQKGPVPEISIPYQTIRPKPAQEDLLESEGEPPLIVSSSFYKGTLIYFAFDYTRIPEEIRTVFAGFWNEIIFPIPPSTAVPSPFGNAYRARLEDNPRVQKHLHNIQGLQLPEMKWFALFFFVYLVAIGPFQYMLLNFLKRNYLLWTTFPAVITLFTILSLGYSKYRHSATENITQVSVIEIYPELQTETLFQAYGVVIGETGSFNLEAVPQTSYLTRPVRNYYGASVEPFTLSEDLPHMLQNERNKSYTFRTFDAISAQALSYPLKVEARIEEQLLKGTVYNSGNSVLQDSFFVYDGKNSISVGDIPARSHKTFNFKLTSTSVVPIAEAHLRDLLDLYNISHANPHFFFGNVPRTNGKIVINGKELRTVCNQYVAEYVQIEEAGPQNLWTTDTTLPHRRY
jgi:hypothetical protein